MPRKEFVDLVKEIKKTGTSRRMSKREFIWLFEWYEKRTSGNVWRINKYLQNEKMIVVPSYQSGWIDEQIDFKEKDKATLKKGIGEEEIEKFDPISRLSLLEAASKTPVSVKRDDRLEKAYHLMWQNDYSQLPIMNNEREIIGLITWQSIAKGLIANKESKTVKDFVSKNYKILEENTPLFDAIKEVINCGVVFVKDKNNLIKGPVTPFDLNEEFIEQIEPFILLEQIENFIRLILDNKIVLEDILKLILIEDKGRNIQFLSDLTFGEYLRILENSEMWKLLNLPFDKRDFTNNLNCIREIRNDVMHFHPDKISKDELELLRKTSVFLFDFISTR
jgi:predicted transcriptional regulator